MRHLRLSVLLVPTAALLSGPTVPIRVPSTQGDMVVKHKWDVIPDNWLSLGPPLDDNTIELHISLQPKNKNALLAALYEVSEPGNPKYGAHLSKRQVAELVAPHPNTLEIVTSWLGRNGVPTSSISLTHGGGWLTVTEVPVSQANELLGASYQFYYHAGWNDTILRTASYSLPAPLHVHVKTVVPTTAFTSTRLLQQGPRRRSDEAAVLYAASEEPVNILSHREQEAIYPSALRELYHTDTYVPPVAANSRLGIVGSNDEHPDLKDQSSFMTRFMTSGRYETVTFQPIDTNVRKGHSNIQANMFAQYTAAITYPIPITFYKGTGVPLKLKGDTLVIPSAYDAIARWLSYASDQPSNPHTIGLISDGIREENLPPEYMDAMCGLFKNLGARGTTVLVPSGDSGVGSKRFRKFSTNFPASCPFVTSVGGTTGIPAEVASRFSGGGFSDHFDVEKYQKYDADAYVLSLRDEYIDRYRRDGRGVPDIAAQSLEYTLIYIRKEKHMDSTVCSTSTAAAIFALLNDNRLSQGITPFGWVNPWLYGVAVSGFNDITEGRNPGARSKGFSAKVGWDPVTGLGTPNFTALLPMAGITVFHQPERRNLSFHDQPWRIPSTTQ